MPASPRVAPTSAPGAVAGDARAFELAGTRWPAVEQGPRQLLVVPVGSLEQHGPHLPLDMTDQRPA